MTGDACPGWLLDQGYGEADIPERWVPVQRCDDCRRFETDEDAAKAAAEALGTEWEYFEPVTEVVGDEFFDAGLGDYGVRLPPAPATAPPAIPWLDDDGDGFRIIGSGADDVDYPGAPR